MTSKFNVAVLIIASLAITGCVDLGFHEPQPLSGQEIKQLPTSFQGIYINKEDTIRIVEGLAISGKDTTIITTSESFKIREWKGKYFLNSKEEGHEYWTVAVLSLKRSTLELYLPEVAEEDLEKLQKNYEVEVIHNEEGKIHAFILEPSPDNWKKLLKSEFYQKESFKKIQ